MHWIAPSEKDTDNAALEKRLWDTVDQFRARALTLLPPPRRNARQIQYGVLPAR